MAKISSYADGGNPAAADQFIIVRSGVNKKLVWNTIYTYLATLLAPIAKGVTNGDTHDHVGGDGAAIGTTAISNNAVTYAKMQNVSATDKVLGRVSAGSGNVEEATFTNAAQTLLAHASAYVAPTAFTPTIEGSGTAGTGTYTTQIGYYSRVGNIVFFSVYIVWTAQDGAGNLRIGGLPVAAANTGLNVALAVNWSNLALPGAGYKVTAYVVPGQQYINVYSIDNAAIAFLALDTAASIGLSGFYFV